MIVNVVDMDMCFKCMCMSIYMSLCVQECILVHVSVYMYVSVRVSVYKCVRVCLWVCECVGAHVWEGPMFGMGFSVVVFPSQKQLCPHPVQPVPAPAA